MGKQVRFYTLPNDEQRLLEFIYGDADIELIEKESFSETRPRALDKQDVLGSQYPAYPQIFLWRRSFPLDKFIEPFVRQKLDPEKNIFVDTGIIAYRFRRSNAPVIEYSRSWLTPDGKLTKGRLWAEMYYWDQRNNLIHKDKGFEIWYDKIARWVRRNFSRIENQDGYFGDQAKEWLLQNKVLLSR